jgi:glycosyltransferase involved in cell wall biosynthesis
MKDKILVICYDYGLNKSPNALRWSEIAKNWVLSGKDVFLLTTFDKNFKKNEIVDGVNIIRTGKFLFHRTHRIDSDIQNHKGNFCCGQIIKFYFKRFLFLIHDYTWKKIYWPDFAILWSLFTVCAAKRIIDSNKIDYCIVASRPFSNSIIPFLLSKINKNLKWSIDYIDPFYISKQPVNNNFLFKRLNRKFEHKIISKAHKIFVLNERIKNELIKTHSIEHDKFKVIPNIYLGISNSNFESNSPNSEFKIVVSYIGSLNGNFRSPKDVLKVFNEIIKLNNNIELHFYGEILFCEKYFNKYQHLIDKNIFLKGVIDRESAISVMKASDFLLNIGNDNNLQEPSKLMDYIAVAKPIINISKIDNDASQDLLKMYNQSITILINEFTTFDQIKLNKIVLFMSNPPNINLGFREKILADRSALNISNLFLD